MDLALHYPIDKTIFMVSGGDSYALCSAPHAHTCILYSVGDTHPVTLLSCTGGSWLHRIVSCILCWWVMHAISLIGGSSPCNIFSQCTFLVMLNTFLHSYTWFTMRNVCIVYCIIHSIFLFLSDP